MTSTTTLSGRLNALADRLPIDRTLRNEPLAGHTYFRLGGPADILTIANNTDDLVHAVSLADRFQIPYFILGGGSNILVGDKGVRGLVVKNEARRVDVDGVYVVAESGALMSQVASFAIDHGRSGMEMFMSVPGTVGGAVFNNSHYRPEKGELIGNLVDRSEIFRNGKRRTVTGSWFNFRYDYSRLHDEPGVVLRVWFRTENEDSVDIRKRALALMARRNVRQPMGVACSGCTFKNADGVSVGFLIDQAGLKGLRVGGAQVSDKHANFIINKGTATVHDVLELMRKMRQRVAEHAGVILEPEIFLIGEFSHLPLEFRSSWRHSLSTAADH